MDSSACPVCTLFLRQGISLEEHLETHPKDQVIEALVNSIRNRDTESQHLTNGYAMQTLPLRSTQYYELPSQCLPLQSYQSNAIAYQQLLPNSSAPPTSPSPYVPVTMFMSSNGTPNQPALMQMVCNPYNVMQIQQQQPVQLSNQRSSGLTQQTGFPKPIPSPLSNSTSSSQYTHMSSIKQSTGVSSTLHSFSNSSHNNNNNSDVQEASDNVDAIQSPCSNADNNRNSSMAPSSNSPMASPHRLSNTEEAQPSLSIEDENESSVAVPKPLPILRGSPPDAAAINSGLTNRVRVIRVLPPPGNLCFDPKLRKSTAPLPGDTANTVPITFPRKVMGLPHPSTETGEICKSLMPRSSLQSLRSELRELVTTYNSNDGCTVQEPEYIDLPPFANSTVENVTYQVNFSHNRPTSSKTDVLNNELDNSNSSSQQNSVNKLPDLRDCQVDKSPPLTLKPMDIELSRINLTDLGNKPCSSKPSGRIGASTSNQVNSFDELSTEASNSSFQNPKSPTLRVRTDLNKIQNKDDEINDCQVEEVQMRVLQQPSTSPRKSACAGPFLESDDLESNPKSSSSRRSQTSVSPDLVRVSVSPKLNNESASRDSSPKSLSPGLRIRTDLSSLSLGSDGRMNRRERQLKAQHLLSQLDSNEVTAVLGMVRSSLEIQLPPVSVPDNDEYITSDCNYSAEDDIGQETTAPDETKTEVSSPVKTKTLFSNLHRSSSSDEVVSFEPSSPVNIIEIDGIHIIVPRQFYEEQHEGLASDIAPTSQPPSDRNEGPRETQLEITPLQNVNHLADRRLSLREFSKKATKDYGDDTQVSTSYDLLARESWAGSDGSDADCRPPTPAAPAAWAPPPPPRKPGRIYKCITCGETFDCPKERRVHCGAHKQAEVIAQAQAEPVKGARKRVAGSASRRPKQRPRKTGCQVLFVRNEATSFMGVFVKDTGEENKMQSEEEEPADKATPPVDEDDVKREVKEVPVVVEDKKVEVKEVATTEAKLLRCLTCEEQFGTRKHLQQHVRLVHNGGEWKHMCDRCQEVFPTELLYNQHLRVHPLECGQCGKNFHRRQNLLVHTKRHLGVKPHKCNACDKAFVTKQKLGEHQNTHTGATPLKCPLCPSAFRRHSNLIQHKNRVHFKIKKKVKDFVCHCGEVFHSRKKLAWHKETHDARPKSCAWCSERFVHAASLTRHVRRAHDPRHAPQGRRDSDNAECGVCGRVLLGGALAVHMRLHAGDRPHACVVCGRAFATRWNLRQHAWVHAPRTAKPFRCSLCRGAFCRAADYARHMDGHRNRRPYACNVCGERFARKPNCARHVREHDARKAHACGECGKAFHRAYYLKDHMRVHTGARPHVCHVCGKASSTKSNHNKHVKIHHAREPVNTES